MSFWFVVLLPQGREDTKVSYQSPNGQAYGSILNWSELMLPNIWPNWFNQDVEVSDPVCSKQWPGEDCDISGISWQFPGL